MEIQRGRSLTRRGGAQRSTRFSSSIPRAVRSARTAEAPLFDAARDMQLPISEIHKSVKLVHEQELGPLTRKQRQRLTEALDRCECVEHLIGDVLALQRLRTVTPGAVRTWNWIREIREAVDDALRPWAGMQNVSVFWDGNNEGSLNTFGDPVMLPRLIANLAIQAIKMTQPGQAILIRFEQVRGGEAIRWSVVNQGTGLDSQQVRAIREGHPEDNALGLAVCRQLAAVHYSPLKIRSRVGYGTQLSFETPASGPTSVAECWSRWRIGHLNAVREEVPAGFRSEFASPRGAVRSPADVSSQGLVRTRLDAPTTTLELHHENANVDAVGQVIAGTVSLGATLPQATADRFDVLLQHQLRIDELVYRTDARRWVWVFDTAADRVQDRLQSITTAADKQIGNVRLHWGDRRVIALDGRQAKQRLSDLLVRHTLAPRGDAGVSADLSQRPMGTRRVATSRTAESRLDREIRRLRAGQQPS